MVRPIVNETGTYVEPVLKLCKILNYYEQDRTSIGVFGTQLNIYSWGFSTKSLTTFSVVDVQLGSKYSSKLCMLELSNVFNPFHIFFLHKLERNWSNIFIAVCIRKEFSSIFNTLRMLELYFCKNFVNKEFLEGWNLALNVFKRK